MKILVYETREDELDAIRKLEKELPIEIRITTEIPSLENVSMAKGYDGISILGQGRIDGPFLDALARLNVHYISTRTIGYNHIDLEYAKKRDCDAIIHYLQEFETIAESRIDRKFCENLVVNSIVSVFFRQAEERGIRMETDIRMRKETAIRNTEMVAILANLLENAVKGCMEGPKDPWIHLMIQHKGNKLIIQCKNSCAENNWFICRNV